MKNIKILTLPLVVSSAAVAQQAPVYPANAGAYTTIQNMPLASVQGVQPSTQSNNIFLEYYARQGNDFSTSVFFYEKNTLVKRDISYDDLKKAVVIFFGDWCPHCHKFITEFSKHIATLTKNGINVIFLHVPSVEKLQNWRDPSVQDYQAVVQKLNSYGIIPSKNIKTVLLGSRTALSQVGISGLPVFLAVKNSKEYFRGIGDSGVSKLRLSEPNVLKQFLEIWGKDEDKKDSVNNTGSKIKSQKAKTRLGRKDTLKSTSKPVKLSGKALIESKTATEMLNSVPWKIDLNSDIR